MSMPSYTGPIRAEPLPIELHNTLFVDGGRMVDGLADSRGLRAWLAALGDRLPVSPGPLEADRLEDFLALRAAVRAALEAVLDGRAVPEDALAELNRASARNPQSLELMQRGRKRRSDVRYHAPTATDTVLGVIAAETIELLGGPRADDLRACGAPGCMLMFLKDHPRREWCSATCGNRVRQARHYAKSRARRAN
jgi:predicted RNA-binding Zn ribbon-like protein